MQDTLLSLQHISKNFGEGDVLRDISLDVARGEFVTLLGASGCGKTTLLNLILGLTQATSGKIMFDGEVLTNVPMQKRGFNIVFQDYALFPNLNAYRNITYGLKNKPGVSSPREVRELVELLGLSEHLDKRIDQLSGGQKQRLSIARAIAKDPKIYLFDDSFSALDFKTDVALRRALKAQTDNATVIIVAQRISTVLHANQILVLDEGRLVGKGTHAQLMASCPEYQEIARSQPVSYTHLTLPTIA